MYMQGEKAGAVGIFPALCVGAWWAGGDVLAIRSVSAVLWGPQIRGNDAVLRL